ncbi:DNA replication protein psf1 [Polyrhizophydium stewartii]|uniref:DNA replication complex GINS protein PSF1 n=1 Tax=Polyrhizophydium stewartii TaxID=2732419 RepID=A0ABR4NIM1_9FUNG|nr:DNA replication protein psf1 [Polyrhizophydium stewartii]
MSARLLGSSSTQQQYADTAVKLVKEAVRARETPSLTAYNDGLVRDTVLECKHLDSQLATLRANVAVIQGQQLAPAGAAVAGRPDGVAGDGGAGEGASVRPKVAATMTAERADAAVRSFRTAAAIHTFALKRNKRCVLAYQRSRLDRLVEMLWDGPGGASTASSLPDATTHQMSIHECEFVDGYKALASALRGHFIDLDLGASIAVPPRDVFAEIRVLVDCGEIMTESGPLRLTAGSQHYLRRSDVEDLILSGDVVQVG